MPIYTVVQLGTGALSTTLTTTLVTIASGTTTIVTSISLCNTNTTTARNVTMDINSRKILSARPLAAGETLIIQGSFVMSAAQLIRGGQDTGTDVEYVISGVNIT